MFSCLSHFLLDIPKLLIELVSLQLHFDLNFFSIHLEVIVWVAAFAAMPP